MIRFVYPNVKAATFIGCGRYAIFEAGEPPAGYALAQPDTRSRDAIQETVAQFAPDYARTPRYVYEMKDQPGEAYRGESLDLAYFLALIACSQSFRFTHGAYDIWCTGQIELHANQPLLKSVDRNSFPSKLHAFLSDANPDQLFILPETNLDHAIRLHLQTRQDVRVGLLKDFLRPDRFAQKTIISIRPHEIPHLIDMLFETPVPFGIENPYRGLFAFREEDAALFFGREADIRELTRAVQTLPVVAVIGSSGSGKSSVVSAGVLPYLRRQGNWLITAFRPGSDPFSALAYALLSVLNPELNEVAKLIEIKRLAKHFYDHLLPLKQFVRTIFTKYPQFHLLIFVDQFEELYTLCQDEQERRHFLDELFTAAQISKTGQVSDWHLTVILTLRADFMEQACAYRPFAEILREATRILGPMQREEFCAVIEKPAALLHVAIEAGLIERIIDVIGAEPGNLPLLEFALTQLWECRANSADNTLTHAAYDRIGGVEQALTQYAEQIYTRLPEAEQAAAQRIFLRLVHPGAGTEATRRLATRSEIGETLWCVATKLAHARLIVTGARHAVSSRTQMLANGNEEYVEIAHEALIRNWPRLQKWLKTEWEFLQDRALFQVMMSQPQPELSKNFLGKLAKWFKHRTDDFSQDEQNFLKKYLHKTRQKQLIALLVSAPLRAFGLFIVLLFLLAYLLLNFDFLFNRLYTLIFSTPK